MMIRAIPKNLTLLVITLFLSGILPTGATSTSLEVQPLRNDVTSEFPTGIRFTLEVELGASSSRADLYYRIGKHPTQYLSTTRYEPTDSPSIEMTVDMLLQGIPPGVPLHYFWLIHFDDGSSADIEGGLVEWIDPRFDWTMFASHDIELFSYSDDDRFNDFALEVAQNSADSIRERIGAPPRPEPLRIWLYNNQSDMSGALSPNSREWIGGVSYAKFSLIAAVVAPGDERAVNRVITHEVFHQIFHDRTANPFVNPAAWLDEGLATAVQLAGLEGLAEVVQEAYRDGTLPSIRSMTSEWGSDRRAVNISYAASYSIVTFIVEEYGEDALLALIDQYSQGASHEDAVVNSLGVSTDELDMLWRESIESSL
ncbi:hypothetical protein BH23CHL5_BH23CHL5_12470 [soil metagenome]